LCSQQRNTRSHVIHPWSLVNLFTVITRYQILGLIVNLQRVARCGISLQLRVILSVIMLDCHFRKSPIIPKTESSVLLQPYKTMMSILALFNTRKNYHSRPNYKSSKLKPIVFPFSFKITTFS